MPNSDAVCLSLVLRWSEAREDLASCLESIADQVEAVGGEIIVVDGTVPAQVSIGEAMSRRVTFVPLAPPWSEARAWEAGLLRARGSWVAFGQAGCRFGAGWATALLDMPRGAHDIVAGPVLPLPDASPSSLATYLCDYGVFADPDRPPTGRAASNNLAFTRKALLPFCQGRGLDKTTLLAGGTFRVIWSPGMRVTAGASRAFWDDTIQRVQRARHYARVRSAAWPPAWRMIAALACPILPAWLLARMVFDCPLRKRFGSAFLRGAPRLAAALWAWSLGEMAGYLTRGPEPRTVEAMTPQPSLSSPLGARLT